MSDFELLSIMFIVMGMVVGILVEFIKSIKK